MGGIIHFGADIAIRQAAKRAAFIHWFGIGRREADTLAALVDAMGQPLNTVELATLCQTNTNSITVSVCVLRKVMEAEAIDRDVQGYRLTDEGMIEARQALNAMAQSLVA